MTKKKLLKNIFILLFITFIIAYVIELTGYYEYKLQNKTIMTNEAMTRFEEDIKEGKDVLLEDYLISTEKDYTSTLTKQTNKLSLGVNKILKKGIEEVFVILSKLVEE